VLPLTLFPKLRMKKVTDGGDRELSFIQEDKDEDADFAVVLPEPMAKGTEYILNFTTPRRSRDGPGRRQISPWWRGRAGIPT